MTYQWINREDARGLAQYDHYVENHPNGSVCQTSAWAGVKRDWGHEFVLIRDVSGNIAGAAMILIRPVPGTRKTFLYAPYGPVCDYADTEVMETFRKSIDELARRYHACLFRMDPLFEENETEKISQFQQQGYLFHAHARDYSTIQCRHHYILELAGKTQDDVFMGFHQKWRYNIRLAQRRGVTCTLGGPEDFDDFYELMCQTGARDGFLIRSKEYLKRIPESFGERCRLYLCRKDGNLLSGALTVQSAHTAYYLYGASSNQDRNLMPNYLMQWRMIQWAMQNGCTAYDFMGIPRYQDENSRQYGIYRFKQGFGGRVVSYAGEFDRIYSPLTGRALHAYLSIKNLH